MLPEFLISNVILALCEDRLIAVVDDSPGPIGPWLVGHGEAPMRLRDLLETVDPLVVLLTLCGWQTTAIDIIGPASGGTQLDHVDLANSSLCCRRGATGPDGASWYVPVWRDSSTRELAAGVGWELRLSLSHQPLLPIQRVIPLAELASVHVDASDERRAELVIAASGASAFSTDALWSRLVEDTDTVLQAVGRLLAQAVGRLGKRLDHFDPRDAIPDRTGLLSGLAPATWLRDIPDSASLTRAFSAAWLPIASRLSDTLMNPDATLAELGSFFVEQSRIATEPTRQGPSSVETVREALRRAFEPTRDLLYDVYHQSYRQLAQLLGRDGGSTAWSAWFRERALDWALWFRLHDEGVIDLLAGVDIRERAHELLDRARAGEHALTPEQQAILEALLRRFGLDPRAREAAALLCANAQFGGYVITGVSGAHTRAHADVLAAVAEPAFMWGNWEVVGMIGVAGDEPGPHTFHVFPHPDLRPLVLSFAQWSLSGPQLHGPDIIERRRLVLEASLPGSTVQVMCKQDLEPNYVLMPSPSHVRESIFADGVAAQYDGEGITVGHPDSGLLRPTHTAIASRILVDANFEQDAWDTPVPLFQTHGTATASAIVGAGKFPGVDPRTNSWADIQADGIAPRARILSLAVTQNVALFAHSGAVQRVADAIRYCTGPDKADPLAQVISISLGYKFDTFMGLAAFAATGALVYDELHQWRYDESSKPAIAMATLATVAMAEMTRALLDLHAAVLEADAKGIIICAAAGQAAVIDGSYLGGPAYPGAFPTVIGCAGLRGDGTPWADSFRGAGVMVAVPCAGAWGAKWKDAVELHELSHGRYGHAAAAGTQIEILQQSEGTSYATALTAAVASLWVQKHRQALKGRNAAALFRQVLRGCGLDPVRDRAGVVQSSVDWGHGKLNAERILSHPLPS